MNRRRTLVRDYSATVAIAARLLDTIAIVAAGYIGYIARVRDWILPPDYEIALLLAALLSLVIFPYLQIYQAWRVKNLLAQFQELLFAWSVVAVALVMIGVATKTNTYFSRNWMVYWYVLGLTFLTGLRFALVHVLRTLRSRGINLRKVVVVGAGRLGIDVLKRLQQEAWTGLQVKAFVDDREELQGKQVLGVPVVGRIKDLPLTLKRYSAEEVWLALPLSAESTVKELTYALRHETVAVRYVPDIFELRLLNHAITEVAGMPVLDLNVSPMIGINRIIKGAEDRLLATIMLLLALLPMLVIAMGVKLSSPGPVLFKQRRSGWDGQPINIYKFRTMFVGAPEDVPTQARRNDPRVTRLGRLLRRTSLDELPQLINVLQGKMSIVGPRPHAIGHNDQFKDLIDDYMQRHKVKPGITGWAQVNGWRGETDTLEKMKKRVEFDLYYIENWSLWFDFKIILLTSIKGFYNRNAY